MFIVLPSRRGRGRELDFSRAIDIVYDVTNSPLWEDFESHAPEVGDGDIYAAACGYASVCKETSRSILWVTNFGSTVLDVQNDDEVMDDALVGICMEIMSIQKIHITAGSYRDVEDDANSGPDTFSKNGMQQGGKRKPTAAGAEEETNSRGAADGIIDEEEWFQKIDSTKAAKEGFSINYRPRFA